MSEVFEDFRNVPEGVHTESRLGRSEVRSETVRVIDLIFSCFVFRGQ